MLHTCRPWQEIMQNARQCCSLERHLKSLDSVTGAAEQRKQGSTCLARLVARSALARLLREAARESSAMRRTLMYSACRPCLHQHHSQSFQHMLQHLDVLKLRPLLLPSALGFL